MMVSVAICTWNRANLLNQTLGRLASVYIPSGVTWELLVVNNNSTDETENVITSHTAKLPLRRYFEACPGLSNARNRALREAQGDLIIWTDDDVFVQHDWLAAYVAAANRWPKAVFFGGPIEPWFEGEAPEWLRRIFSSVENAFATCNLGAEPILLGGEKFPFGANMAMRTVEHRRYMYDPELGLQKNRRVHDEETVLFEQMIRDGLKGRWVPDAKVQHFIPKERQTIKYLRSYYRGRGLTSGLRTKEKEEECPKLFGKPRWVLRKAIQGELLFWFKRFILKPEYWIQNFIQANTYWGILLDSPFRRMHLENSATLKVI